MERDTVKEIIAVEKEIQRQVEAERTKLGSWLAETRERAEKQYEADLAAFEQISAAERNRAAEEAEIKASAIIGEAEEEYDGWRHISDSVLEKILTRHLEKLITGEWHDSPDVEN